MKTLLMAATALTLAAAAGAAQAQTGDWSGPYVGATLGYANGSDKSSETILFDTNLDGAFGDTVRTGAGADAFSPGFCGGSFNTNAAPGGCRNDDDTDVEWSVRAGWDLQFGQWVVGVLGEYSRLELQDTVTAFSTTPAAYAFTRKLTDTAALRARAGYAFGDILPYATAGFAWANVDNSFRTTNTVNAFPAAGGDDADGYQFGLGVEYKVLPNVTVGVEWLRTELEEDGFGVRAANSGTTAPTNPFLLVNTAGTDFQRSNDDIEFNTFRVTTSFRF